MRDRESATMTSDFPFRCRWVPWAIAGAFGVIFMVNGALAYFALSSDTGLVTEHPFALGSGYNRVLDAAAAQDALGWHASLRYVAMAPQHGMIAVDLHDAQGRPLTGIVLRARVVRPLGPLPEADLILAESGGGHYAAPVALARPGQWEVRAAARRSGDLYEFQQRIVVP